MTPKTDRRHALASLAALAALPSALRAQAAWPTQPIKVLVGFPGGSSPDVAIRTLADGLARALGQPVVVDNRPGASGNIAAELVAKATDDHTLGIVINGNLTTARLLNPKLGFDPDRDFTPLSLLTTAPLVLVAPAAQPGGAAFFAAARQAGDRWSYGSVGPGSVAHLGMEALKARTGLAAVHVPYRGNPQVVTALVAGEVQMALVPPGLAMPQVKAGKLRAVGVTGSGRSALAPDVPPLAEAGVQGFELEVWTALVGPARLSAAARNRLAQEVPRLLKEADIRERLFAGGWRAVGTAPDGLVLRVREERQVMERLVATGRVRPE